MADFTGTVLDLSAPLQHKRATQTVLMASDYVAASGEIVAATDTGVIKVGDGTHTWAQLPQADATEIANNYTETVAGKALDAVKGKDLNDRLTPFEDMTGIDCGVITNE